MYEVEFNKYNTFFGEVVHLMSQVDLTLEQAREVVELAEAKGFTCKIVKMEDGTVAA